MPNNALQGRPAYLQANDYFTTRISFAPVCGLTPCNVW